MKNFGKIKDVINTILAEGLSSKDQEKKDLFKKYVRAINENKALKAQFKVYTAIESMVEENEFKASEKIKGYINTLDSFSKEELIEANMVLAGLIGMEEEGEDTGYTNEDLHKHITTLIFESDNIDSFVDSLTETVGFAKTNSIKESGDVDILPNSVLSSVMVDKFNEEYSEISEDEKRVLQTIIEASDEGRETILIEMTRECIDLVDGRLAEASLDEKDSLLKVKDKLLRNSYDADTFVSEVSKLIELKKDLAA
jgi:hypothetical protein